MTKTCCVCGKEIKEDAAVCRNCGKLMCGSCAQKNLNCCPDCLRDIVFFS